MNFPVCIALTVYVNSYIFTRIFYVSFHISYVSYESHLAEAFKFPKWKEFGEFLLLSFLF